MTYFDCFVLVAWTFVIGWFAGAIFMQNRSEQKKTTRAVVKPEPCPNCDALRLPATQNTATAA